MHECVCCNMCGVFFERLMGYSWVVQCKRCREGKYVDSTVDVVDALSKAGWDEIEISETMIRFTPNGKNSEPVLPQLDIFNELGLEIVFITTYPFTSVVVKKFY